MTEKKSTLKPVYILCFSPYLGGMELDSIKLANLLSTKFSIHLVIRAKTQLAQRCAELPLKFPVHKINFFGSFHWRCIKELKKLWHHFGQGPVIFLGASELKSIFFALQPGQFCIVRHGTTKTHSKKDFFHQWLYKKVTHHVALGKHLQKNVLDIFPGPKICHIIEPSCTLPFRLRTQENLKPNHPRILIFGRIQHEKGQKDGLLALLNLAKKGITFTITIQGPVENETFYQELTELAKQFGPPNPVTFLGPSKNVQEVYQQHDLLLFPSYGEGVPNTLIESFWSGLLPITYDNTCFPDFIQKGFYIKEAINQNIDDLTSKICEALQDFQEKSLEMAHHNQQRAQQLFSPAREISDWTKLLEKELTS